VTTERAALKAAAAIIGGPHGTERSVAGGDFFDRLDDEDVDGCFVGFELQAELVLEEDEDGRALFHSFEGVFEFVVAGGKFEGEIEAAF